MGLQIQYNGKTAVITASETAYLFRGLMTLVMKAEQYEAEGKKDFSLSVQEPAHFEKNGAMIDCSRNCVMSVEAVKAWIRMQAAVGMNTLLLYTEDTYEVLEYPYFGAMRSRYKKEEIQEMDQYAQLFGIELIPCIQTLGHLQRVLQWRVMRQLGDTKDILLVGEEQVYQLIRACLKQVSECFTTKRVHVGMDEACELGNYLLKNGYRDKDKILKEHLNRVMEICHEFGLEPMMWSDMFFRSHSENGDYYNVPFDTDMRKTEAPPKGMGLVYWDYYHVEEEFYRGYIRLHRQLSDYVIFAGGGWCWNGIVPNNKTGCAVTHAALQACKKEQVNEIIYTLWGDDSTETPIFSSLEPVLLCAEYGFGETPKKQELQEKFEFLTGCSYEEYQLLGDFDIWSEEVSSEHINSSRTKNMFYQDVMLGMYDGQMEGVLVGAYYEELANKMKAAHEKAVTIYPEAVQKSFWGNEMEQILDYYGIIARTLAVKADLGLRICNAYLNKDRDTLRTICQNELTAAIDLTEQCRRQREKIWMREGRICGWEILDIRFRALTGRLQSAKERLEAYLRNELQDLPELEEPRLKLKPEAAGEKRYDLSYNSWSRTVSPSQLALE